MPERSGFQPLDCLAAIPAWGVAPGWDGGSPLALGVVGIFGRLEALPRRLVSFVHLECVAESLALREASRLIPSKAAFVLWPLRRGESGLKPRPTSRALSRLPQLRFSRQRPVCGWLVRVSIEFAGFYQRLVEGWNLVVAYCFGAACFVGGLG